MDITSKLAISSLAAFTSYQESLLCRCRHLGIKTRFGLQHHLQSRAPKFTEKKIF